MNLWFKGKYDNGETDLLFRTEHLKSDLQRLGYDKEHIDTIIECLTTQADEIERLTKQADEIEQAGL